MEREDVVVIDALYELLQHNIEGSDKHADPIDMCKARDT